MTTTAEAPPEQEPQTPEAEDQAEERRFPSWLAEIGRWRGDATK
ncbi:hypothetical protein A8924_3698 [Saccharopolyspora erythraea NRRL 2338]|nr:hypothetical protein [Saccharopolyspora erythraea]PFG96305.1 hypothetical protein A8924_3698 [Saccharopolyspora erythraea NRRL 2338]